MQRPLKYIYREKRRLQKLFVTVFGTPPPATGTGLVLAGLEG